MAKERAEWKLNAVVIDSNPRTLFGAIIEALPDLQFRSVEGLKQIYTELTSLSKEMAEEEYRKLQTTIGKEAAIRKGALTRFINLLGVRERRVLPNDRTGVLQIIYEAVLASEGLGLLPGFGSAKKGGKGIGNSEKESIYDIPLPITTIKREEKDMSEKNEIKRSALVVVGKELNEILDPEPPINVKAKPSELTEQIKIAAELLVPEDELSEETRNILQALGCLEKEKEAPKPESKEEKKTKASAPAPESKKEKTAPTEKKGSATAGLMEFLTSQIKKGKFTREQIRKEAIDLFPDLKTSTISTILTDGKNPKYSKFPVPYMIGEKGNLYFPEKK